MKLKKNTLLLLLVAILLGSWVYIFEIKDRGRQQLVQKQNIFNIEIKDIQKIVIDSSEGTFEFIPLGRNWQMVQPEKTIVNLGVMTFLLDLIIQGKSNFSLNISANKLEQYGLEVPFATIKINLIDGTQKNIELGKETIDPNVIYAQITPSLNKVNSEILLVSKNWQYAIAELTSRYSVSQMSKVHFES